MREFSRILLFFTVFCAVAFSLVHFYFFIFFREALLSMLFTDHINNTRYKRIQSLIHNHMRRVRSESTREQRIALYKSYE